MNECTMITAPKLKNIAQESSFGMRPFILLMEMRIKMSLMLIMGLDFNKDNDGKAYDDEDVNECVFVR